MYCYGETCSTAMRSGSVSLCTRESLVSKPLAVPVRAFAAEVA